MKRLLLLPLLLISTLGWSQYTASGIGAKKINNSDGTLATSGDKVLFKGIVHSLNLNGFGLLFNMYDSTGNITVYYPMSSLGYSPNPGDSITVRGRMYQLINFMPPRGNVTTGYTMLYLEDSVRTISLGHPVKPARKVKNLDESTESELVAMDSLVLNKLSAWKKNAMGGPPGMTTYTMVTVHKAKNPADSFKMQVSSDIISGMSVPTGIFNVRGIGIQNDPRSPLLEEYVLFPRDVNDFSIVSKTAFRISKIRDIRHYNGVTGVADSAGKYFFVQGVVQSPNFGATSMNFSLYDSTGDIMIQSTSILGGYGATPGDSIVLGGVLDQPTNTIMGMPPKVNTTGLTVILIDTIHIFSFSNPVHSPVLTNALDEKLEARLVTLNGLKMVDPSQWDTTTVKGPPGPGNQQKEFVDVDIIDQANHQFVMRIYKVRPMWYWPKPDGFFNLTGIVSQKDASPPMLGDYYIIPRDTTDFELLGSTGIDGSQASSAGGFRLYPNPAGSEVFILNPNISSGNVSLGIYNISGQAVQSINTSSQSLQTGLKLDISFLPSGIYYVSIKYDNGLINSRVKFVKSSN